MDKKKCAIIVAVVASIVLSVIVATTKEEPYPRQLVVADSLVQYAPDSAIAILRSPSIYGDNLPERVLMYRDLILLKAACYGGMPIATDSIPLALVRYYESKGDQRLLSEAYYYAGKACLMVDNSPLALDLFHKVLDVLPEKETSLRSRTYTQIGYIYREQMLVPEALDMFRKAFSCDKAMLDTASMIYSLRDMGTTYTDMGKTDSALLCYSSAFHLSETAKNEELGMSVKGQLARLYIAIGDYESARKLLQEAWNNGGRWDRLTLTSLSSFYYMAIGEPDSALRYHRELLEIGTAYSKQLAYEALSKHFISTGENEKARQSLEMYRRYIDSVQSIIVTQQIAQKRKMYSHRQKEIEMRELEAHNRELFMVICALSSGFVILLITLYFIIKYNKKKREALKFKLEKYQKHSETSAKLDQEAEKLHQPIESTYIFKRIRKMLNNPIGQSKLHDNDWQELASTINKIYPGFDEKISCRVQQQMQN